MNPSPAKFTGEQVLNTLEKFNSKLFARAIYSSPELFQLLEDGNLKLLMVPSDRGVAAFLEQTNRSLGDLSSSQLGRDIIANHTAATANLTDDHYFAINGEYIPLDNASLQRYKALERGYLGDILVVFMDGFIITESQLSRWLAERSTGIKTFLGGGQLGNEGLKILISKGDINGLDLISLCNTNFEVYDFCNSRDKYGNTMFHRLLESEFGIEVPAYEDAKEVYIRQYNVGKIYFLGDQGNLKLGTHKAFQIGDGLYAGVYNEGNMIFGLTEEGALEIIKVHNSDILGIEHFKQTGEYPLEEFQESDESEAPLGTRFRKIIGGRRFLSREGDLYTADLRGNEYILRKLNPPDTTTICANLDGLVFRDERKGGLFFKFYIGREFVPVHPGVIDCCHDAMLYFLRKGREGESHCVIIDSESLTQKTEISLLGFPGGSYKCSAAKIKYAKIGTHAVSILNDIGEIWIARDAVGRPQDWEKLDHPQGRKFTEHIFWRSSVKSGPSRPIGFRYQMGIMYQIYDERPEEPKYVFSGRALDDQGRIFKYFQGPTGKLELQLFTEIPGLLKLTMEDLFPLGASLGAVLVRTDL